MTTSDKTNKGLKNLYTVALTTSGFLFILLYAYYKLQPKSLLSRIFGSIKKIFTWNNGNGSISESSSPSTQQQIQTTPRIQNNEPLFNVENVHKKHSYVVCIALNYQSPSTLDFIKELHTTTMKKLILYNITKVASDEEEIIKNKNFELYFNNIKNGTQLIKRQLFCETEFGITSMLRQIEPRFVIVSSEYKKLLNQTPRLMKKTQFIVIHSSNDPLEEPMNVGKQVIHTESLKDVLPIISSF